MPQKKVTLKANLAKGSFYWVSHVEADSDEEAIVAAENLFLHELERVSEWEFSEFDVE